MKRVAAVVLAGGEGERLSILSGVRAKPAVPFAGKYRIIDFTLSNCVNSDINDVVVLTQYNPRSLNDHIGAGRPWDLDRSTGGVRMLQPFISRNRAAEWYRGTADAVLQNVRYIRETPADTLVILAGDHIYKMDYGPFVQQHRRKRADVTIAVKRVPLGEAHRFGILALDDNDQVIEWQEKPKQPRSDLASLGIYVFSKRALLHWMSDDRPDFGANVVPAMLAGGARVFGYHFDGYWQDVGTVDSYWRAQMELLDDHPGLDLYDRDWVIHTRSEERAPARIGPTASVHRSLISHGCLIAGTVERSVLSPGVRVDPGAIVRDSVIMFDSHIRAGAVVDRAILDKEVSVGPNAIVGMGNDFDTPNLKEPTRLNTGITLVGKRAVIPAGARIGRNVRIAEDVRPSDFTTKTIKSGGSVEPKRPRHETRPARGGDCRRGRPAGRTDERTRVDRDLRCGDHRPRCHALATLDAETAERHRVRRRDRAALPCPRCPVVSTAGCASWSWCPSSVPSVKRVVSWDLLLDGRRRHDIRLTLILDPDLALLCWAHYAPPLNDTFRVSYRQFLHWNDELPFVKFALADDERPVLVSEVPVATLDRDTPGSRPQSPAGGLRPAAGRVVAVALSGCQGGPRADAPGAQRWAAGPLCGRPGRAVAGSRERAGRGFLKAAATAVGGDRLLHSPPPWIGPSCCVARPRWRP